MSEKATSVLMFVAAVERELGRRATVTEQRFIIAMKRHYSSDDTAAAKVAHMVRRNSEPYQSIFND